MPDTIITVDNLSKCYIIGHQIQKGDGLRHAIERAVRAPFGWLRPPARGSSNNDPSPSSDLRSSSGEEFWALRDVSFEVKQGEVLGVIGRNGAGKSTLLKLLSRITEPTRGRIHMRGRVASLLEVGTGFHPELTGRENIFLNGAILGMSKAEIKRKFDEIVAFSGVEKFLDTPVKRYSSGMKVRLAFAVAAHLEPEILIVDEVLAVGDAEFQRKCLGKMEEVSRTGGRTILFVSHNMTAVQSLCQRAVLLESGGVTMDGPAQEVVQHYLQICNPALSVALGERTDRSGDGSVRLESLVIEGIGPDKIVLSTSRLRVKIKYRSEAPIRNPKFWVTFRDATQLVGLFQLANEMAGGLPECLAPIGVVSCTTEPINLTPGPCFVNIGLETGTGIADYIQYATFFNVEPEDVYGSGKVPERNRVVGVVKQSWTNEI